MSLHSWLRSLRARSVRNTARRVVHVPQANQLAELLEPRCLLAVTPLIINGTDLLVQLESSDNVTIQADASGNLQVTSNGSLVIATPTIAVNTLTSISVFGGDGPNRIDLTNVTTAAFAVGLTVTVNGGDGGDTILGSEFADSLIGGNGADSITGALADDTLEGGNGIDTIRGGVGDDSLFGGDGADSITGDAGNDTVVAGNGADQVFGDAGLDSLNGGDGSDTLSGDADEDTLSGDNGNDSLLGGTENDSILGGSGNDIASGGDGLDTLFGGADNDSMNGELGNDSLDGGDGNDTLLGGDNDDTINGGTGNDSIRGLNGNDSILGGAGNDALFGDDNSTTAIGTGNDTVLGNAGNDSLNGGGGVDSLDGGAGNDLVQSGDFDSATIVSVTISNAANVIEGPLGQSTNAVFTVTLNRASTQVVTVQFATADGSATSVGANADYTSTSATLQFPVGITLAQISVPVIGDGQLEADENFFVRLSNATNAFIADTEGETFIVNDDGWAPAGPAPVINGQVTNITPNDEISGAIQAVAAHPTNPDIMYVGGVQAGIWRTTNARAQSPAWTPQTDFLSSLSIGDIEFDPTDSTGNTLVAGIGRASSFQATGGSETGMLRTTNGGATWTELNAAALQNQTILNVAARGNILMATSDGRWSGGGGQGLFRSTDSGATFTAVSGAAGSGIPANAGPASDLVGDPTNPSRFYVAFRQTGVFRSDDSGATWVSATNGIAGIGNNTTAVFLSVHSNATTTPTTNAVYAAVVGANGQYSGLFRSGNAGANWMGLDIPTVLGGGQGVVHGSIAADPTNPFLVYVGGDANQNVFPFGLDAVRVDASLGSGSQITSLVMAGAQNTQPHADSRRLVFTADGFLILGGDGGVYRRTNPSGNAPWTSLNSNLQTMELHDTSYDTVSNIIFGGAQDNGTNQQTARGSLVWTQRNLGDGGDVAVDTIQLAGQNRSIRYSSIQNLGFFQSEVYDANNNLIGNPTPLPATVQGGGPAIGRQFITPIATNAVAGNRLIIGGSNATYESLDGGQTVTRVGTTNVSVNARNTGTGSDPIAYGGQLNGVPNPDVLYVGSGTQVFLRTVFNANLVATPSAFPGGRVNGIVLDPMNFQNAWVASANGVFFTNNAGATPWVNVTGSGSGALTATQLRTIEFVGGATPAIVVGASNGVFRMLVSAPGVWSEFGASSLPNVAVWELDYDTADDVLVAGTMGRGAWIFANASAGEQFNNPVPGSAGGVILVALGDILIGGDGNDTLQGADGNDTMNGNAGNDSLVGGLGNDSMQGGAGNDTLDGGLGDDMLDGQAGNDRIAGGDGSDTFIWNGAGDGVDTLSSLSGYDRVRVQGTDVANNYIVSQVSGQLQITDGTAVLNVSPIIQVVDIFAGLGNDRITINALDRVRTAMLLTVNGEDGNDKINSNGANLGFVRVSLIGGLGDDTLIGGSGIDSLDGGDGDDSLNAQGGNDLVFGGIGDDTIIAGTGNDRVFGGDGNDNIDAGAGDDSVVGEVGADTIAGGDGNDSIDGGDGTDIINGGSGNDSILGGNEADDLNGSTGNDTVRGGASDDTIIGENGNDSLFGEDGNDSILGYDGDDTLSGGDGDDTLDGMAGNDLVGGGNGDDLMNGAAGNDTLTGGDGNDTIAGGAGNDVLLGDEGDDSLNGQGSTDIINPGEGANTVLDPITEIDTTFMLSAALLAALA